MTPNSEQFKFLTPSNWFSRPVNIVVVGVGGTGSEVLASLARIDYAIRELGHQGLKVTAWDGDIVEKPNVGRQAFYPADIGHNKAIVTVQRINYLFGLEWEAIPKMFDTENIRLNCDLIITCVDVAQFRADLALKMQDNFNKTLWLDAGNGSHTGQVILGHLGGAGSNGFHLPNVFDFYPDLDGMVDDNTPSCSMEEALVNQDLPINRTIANIVMQLVWSLLRHGGLSIQGAYVNIRTGVQTPINIFNVKAVGSVN